MPAERLQKIIAAAGLASRRKAEELITAGRVTVNGQVVSELGSRADTASDDIRVDGKPIHSEQTTYIVLHKPKGYVTTASDPEGRPTVMDLLQNIPQRVFPVGRLDYLSEGLLLLTNDGELAAKLTHASTHVSKRYLVKVSGNPKEEDIQRLREGVVLPPEHGHVHAPAEEGGRFGGQKRRSTAVSTAPAKIVLIRAGDNPWYEVTLVEGRNRQIRRMFSLVGHHVEKIKRVAYGPLELDVDTAQWRALTPAEVSRLQAAASGQPVQERPSRESDQKRISPSKPKRKPYAGASRGSRPQYAKRGDARRESDAPRAPRRDARDFDESRPRENRGPRNERPSGRGFSRPGQRRSFDRPGSNAGERPFKKDRPRFDSEDRPFTKDRRRFEPGERPRFSQRPGGSRPEREDRPQRTGTYDRNAGRGKAGQGSREDRGERPKKFGGRYQDREKRPGRFGGPKTGGFGGSRPAGRPFPKRRDEEESGNEPRGPKRSDGFVNEVARRYADKLGERVRGKSSRPGKGFGRPPRKPE